MAWALLTRIQQSITDLLKSTAPAVLISGQDPTADPAVVNAAIVDANGNVRVGSTGGALATEATLATRASEATLTTRATEATLATRASEATAALIKTATEKVATVTDIATGVLVRQPTATSLKAANEAYLPVSGAAPTAVVGTTGRLPRDYAEDFGGAVTGTWHPLQYGVSVARTIGAGPVAAAAVGKAVTVSGIIVGVTTLANIRAAIAADAPSALLLSLAGDGVVDAGYAGGAAYDLWYSGTIPANCMYAMGPDGYNWPVEMDATGGVKVSQSSQIEGEDATRHVLRVERQGTTSGRQTASVALEAAGTVGRMYGLLADAGAGGMTLNLRKDGVVGGAIIAQWVIPANTYVSVDLHEWPYSNGLYGEINAGAGGFDVHRRNT